MSPIPAHSPPWPFDPHLYWMYDAHGLIYIGATYWLELRLRQHRNNSWWSPAVVRIQARPYDTVEAARSDERVEIDAWNPRYNQNHRYERIYTIPEREFLIYVANWARTEEHRAKAPIDWRTETPRFRESHMRNLRELYRDRFGKPLDIPAALDLAPLPPPNKREWPVEVVA